MLLLPLDGAELWLEIWICNWGTDAPAREKSEPTDPLDEFSVDGILADESLVDPETNSRRSSEVEDGARVPNDNPMG